MHNRLRRHFAATVAAIMAASATVLSVQPAQAEPGGNTLDEVRYGYNQQVLPLRGRIPEWTGNADTCTPGRNSEEDLNLALNAVNYFRKLNGLDPVVRDRAGENEALHGAIGLLGQGKLQHALDPGSRCYSHVGDKAVQEANLYMGPRLLRDFIVGWMDDPGPSNKRAGHRAWLLRPELTSIGHGFASGAAVQIVLKDLDSSKKLKHPVAWPSSGWFPSRLEPRGRWSVMLPTEGMSRDEINGLRVKVTNPDGNLVNISELTFGPHWGGAVQLVWDMPQPAITIGSAIQKWTVTVENIVIGGKSYEDWIYDVVLFDPHGYPNEASAGKVLQPNQWPGHLKGERASHAFNEYAASHPEIGTARGVQVDEGSRSYRDHTNGRLWWTARHGVAFTKEGFDGLAKANSWLGYPLENEQPRADGSAYQTFENGILVWNPKSGLRIMTGAIQAAWSRAGGPTGAFGLPTSDEIQLGDYRVVQHFEGGDAYWAPGAGAWFVYRGNKTEWERLGGINGSLGAPTGNEVWLGNNVVVQTFQGGRIYWSPSYGARAVHGAILERFLRAGGHEALGVPMTGEYAYGAGVRQDFAGAVLLWP